MIHFQEYQQHIPQDFNDNSKVWIYQSNRIFAISEALQIEPLLEEFVANWKSHNVAVRGFANILFGQFIVLIADETNCTVGGCSTDSSVRLIKQIEQEFKVELFNRQSLAFIVKDKIQILPFSQINYALDNEFITPETLYFNNLVLTKRELLNNWIIPINKSWLASKIKSNAALLN